QPVNQIRIAVEVEDDGLVGGKQRVVIRVRKSVGMVLARLELEKIHHVDKTDLDVGKLLAKQYGRSQCLLSRDVSGSTHHDVRFGSVVVTGPIPDAKSLSAMFNRLIHIQVLKVQLLIGNDHIDVVLALQAVVGDREQAVGVGRQVDARHCGTLIQHHVEETRVLVGKAVVVLAPNRGCDQKIE